MIEKKRKLIQAAEDLIKEAEKSSLSFVMPSYLELSDFRKRIGLSLRDVAKETGVSAATISRIERGGEAEHGQWVKLCAFYFKYEA